MPFTRATAAAAGASGGGKRWKDKDPTTVRSERMSVNLAAPEIDFISDKAAALGHSRAEFILRAARAYEQDRYEQILREFRRGG